MTEQTRVLLIDITGDWLSSEMASEGRSAQAMQKAARPLVSYPIGLMYLAASAKKTFGSDIVCTVVSTALDCPTLEGVARLVRNNKPHIVGIRALSMHKDMYNSIVHMLRNTNEALVLLGGGPYPSSEPIQALCGGLVDAVVSGEGEEAFVGILHEYRSGNRQWHSVANVHTSADSADSICVKPVSLPLDSLPFPEYSKSLLYKYEKIKNMSRRYSRHANIVSSRGCPYRCTYCHNIFGKRFRYRSEDNVFEEIRELYETHGIREFQFIDDIFNLRKPRLIGFFDRVVQSGMPLVFSFPNGVRGDILDRESIDAMIDGGTRYIYFAVESASERIQSLICKNLKLARIAENIAYAAEKDCVTGGFFMLGFPTETLEEAQATVKFACETNLTDAYFFMVTHYPGTEMYDLAVENGFESGGEENGNFFATKNGAYAFSQQELSDLSRVARKQFYFSEKRIDIKRNKLQTFFSPKEITEINAFQILSCDVTKEDIVRDDQRQYMASYFSYAQRMTDMGIRYDF